MAMRGRRLNSAVGALVASLAALGGIACSGPLPEAELVTFGGEVMGTGFHVRVATSGKGLADRERVEQGVTRALRAVDDAMTTYRDSEVTRFNAWRSTEPFEVSSDTARVTELALRLARETDGALDITIAPLVEALGFGPNPGAPLPDEVELARLRERIGYQRLAVDAEGRLRKSAEDLEIDLSSIAKGFGVDRAAETLERLGFTSFMVEVGGEVRARGLNERGQPWRIAIERPDAGDRRVQRIVPLSDRAMATSGDYRNYREIEGKRVSHLIDPRTGRSIEHRVASATVLHDECAVADGLATAMMVLGEAGLELAEANGWAVLLLVRQGDDFVERQSSAFGRLLESKAPENA